MVIRDKAQVMNSLKPYKTRGLNNYPALLSINERLPDLYKTDPQQVSGAITVALAMAFESMNLSRPMNEDQILDLVETIIDSSEEDRLALEDVVLFLQGLTRGKYGALYESMDIPKFMEKFEIYREERHQALMNHRYESHVRNKSLPVNDRIQDMFPDDFKEKMREALKEDMKRA